MWDHFPLCCAMFKSSKNFNFFSMVLTMLLICVWCAIIIIACNLFLFYFYFYISLTMSVWVMFLSLISYTQDIVRVCPWRKNDVLLYSTSSFLPFISLFKHMNIVKWVALHYEPIKNMWVNMRKDSNPLMLENKLFIISSSEILDGESLMRKNILMGSPLIWEHIHEREYVECFIQEMKILQRLLLS